MRRSAKPSFWKISSSDIGLLGTATSSEQSNAGHQARREAGAQRTLDAVACMPLFGLAPTRSATVVWLWDLG
jgi:hypothetical protein